MELGSKVIQAQAPAVQPLVVGQVCVANHKSVAARLLRLLLLLLRLAILCRHIAHVKAPPFYIYVNYHVLVAARLCPPLLRLSASEACCAREGTIFEDVHRPPRPRRRPTPLALLLLPLLLRLGYFRHAVGACHSHLHVQGSLVHLLCILRSGFRQGSDAHCCHQAVCMSPLLERFGHAHHVGI